MSMVGIIGLLLAIAILIFGAYKGLGALPLTMIAALVAIVFNGIPLWEGFATHYMAGYTSAYMSYFLMFACSALYAKLMDESGCATAIGYKFIDWFGRKNIMLVTILIVSVLTYGGVSLFVVVYAVAPIMFLLFKEANLPRHLTMACLIVGSATYTMTTLPGTPQLTNVVPTEYLGTPPRCSALSAPWPSSPCACSTAPGLRTGLWPGGRCGPTPTTWIPPCLRSRTAASCLPLGRHSCPLWCCCW